MIADLVQFLRARLDEDEQAASKAAALCGCHPAAPAWAFGDEETGGRILVVDDPHPDLKRRLGRRWNGSYEGMFSAEHIARHDPARVLAEVDAKRQLLDMYEEGIQVEQFVLKEALRAFAAAYGDHPDFREEWRP
ncbi:DUF6221 family protein [Streptomyces erythrochromogenes]|uniref:DUF6221 family protein n=1 Tax=Streptomyces erythrochromogenes TaxID=285574 RepID=UPI0037D932A7